MKHPLHNTTNETGRKLVAIADALPAIDVEAPGWQTASDILRDAGMTNEAAIDLICAGALQAAIDANVEIDTAGFREALADAWADLVAPIRDRIEQEMDDLPRVDPNAEHRLGWFETV
ncbi:hypothetical protein [Oricola thermophila]|uniref:Uncharacterized protein n=1 Tax=Oricola thermophila TaxID=2742145 RepID=A0A6N1VFT5_9HYPH|nr:hypothetical protein [Oricola thermophila]QKV17827.1 hypothetical protein HTY61_04820 [Oricola thermophila]